MPPLKIRVNPSAVSPAFLPYLRSRARYVLLWGGRDSTKSDFVALKLLLDALELPYFLCILVREKQNTIADSQIATLKKVATREGLLPFFKFPTGPTSTLEVRCTLNGNRFIGRGTDDMDRVKSVSDATCAWYEEANQISQADADILSTSLRSSQTGTLIQEIYTFNPDHDGDYTKFWLYKKFFTDTGHPMGYTFAGQLLADVNGRAVAQSYQVVHSTYHNNPWCPPSRAATYEAYGVVGPDGKMRDEYRYAVWCLGNWATRKTGGEFFHKFREAQHVAPTPYAAGPNIMLSWDANSLPYCAMLAGQTVPAPGGGLVLHIFQEYALRSPGGGITPTGRQFLKDRQARGWQGAGVYCTGDASMRGRKPGEENATTFNDALNALATWTDVDGVLVPGCLNGESDTFWLRKNPGVDRSAEFCNEVLDGRIPGVAVRIDPGCVNLINDLKSAQKGPDGMLKKRELDKELNVRYEPIGHFADVFRYYLVTVLAGPYEAFVNGRGG